MVLTNLIGTEDMIRERLRAERRRKYFPLGHRRRNLERPNLGWEEADLIQREVNSWNPTLRQTNKFERRPFRRSIFYNDFELLDAYGPLEMFGALGDKLSLSPLPSRPVRCALQLVRKLWLITATTHRHWI